jgi:N-hydroxyarylamine O-acetyltransferase
VWERPTDEVRARTHLVLLVELGEGPYLCDVGFGGLTPTAPLRLEPDVEQATPNETFRVLRVGPEFAVEARVRGEWRRLYRFDLQEQQQVDVELLNYYVMGHADSPMIGRLVAARVDGERRLGLRDGVLSVHEAGKESEQHRIHDVAGLREVLSGTFGIEVPRGPDVDGALARVLA